MILSQTAEYAVRAMAQLALEGDDQAVRTRDLSGPTGIPAHYLSKIMRRLVASGLLVSEKGHGGGFRFARPLARIRLMDILEAVDASPSANHCAFGWGKCNAARPCPLHPSFSYLNETVANWAEQTTLADVVAKARTPVRRPRGR